MEATGEPHDSRVVDYIVSTFFNAKPFADFDAKVEAGEESSDEEVVHTTNKQKEVSGTPDGKRLNLGLSYTINLVLPKTDDPSVYNAIFKSLRDNLLSE